MNGEPIHTLRMQATPAPTRPRRSPAVLMGALLVGFLIPTGNDDLWMWVRAINGIVAAVAICSLMHTAEQRWHDRFVDQGLAQRLLAHLSLMLAAVAFGTVAVYFVGIPLKTVGDGGTSLVVMIAGTLWLNNAAGGAVMVMVVDRIIRPFTREFRSRMNAAALTLVGLMALIAYWTAQAGVDVLQLSSNQTPSNLRLSLGLDRVWTMDPTLLQELTASGELMTQLYFALMIGVATPAMMSASGKLSQTLMANLDPIKAGFAAIARGELDFRIPEQGTSDFARLNATFNQMVQSLGMAKRMELAFGSYVSEEILDQIKSQHGEANLEPTLRMATVFFVDIRGFTTLSERINPKQLLAILNRFYEEVATVVQSHKGFLVQYIGDAVVVVFNGPLEQPNHADMAAACAVDIQRAVDRLNNLELFPEAGDLRIGIGVATGPLVAGNLGDSDHLLQYTVLGDTVNQASRLTGLTPPGAVYVNQRNAEMIDPNHDPIALDPVKVKGRARKVQPHQIWPRMEFTDVTEVRTRPLTGWPVGEA